MTNKIFVNSQKIYISLQMSKAQVSIESLREKSMLLVHQFENLPEKDIRRKYFEIIATQITVSHFNLQINDGYAANHDEEFKALFGGDISHIENYKHHFFQNIYENIATAALFQTELVFRYYYSKITGKAPGEENSINKIIAHLFEDTENNWTKEEAKFLVLFWTLRNTIHTGGIYLKKTAGYSLTYKGDEYRFEYGKSPSFLANGFAFSMISDLFDSMIYLFESDLIKSLGTFDHPNYYALGK